MVNIVYSYLVEGNDIAFIFYHEGNTSCTILGPPSHPKMLQQTRNFNRVVSDDSGSSQGIYLIKVMIAAVSIVIIFNSDLASPGQYENQVGGNN